MDSSNITSLLQTYSVTKHQNILLLCVQYIMSSITRNVHHVMWEELTAEVVKDILAEIDAGTWYGRVYSSERVPFKEALFAGTLFFLKI